ncbi:hemerythrin domain-containing protein [Phytoactinopolyspora endophytica]|uniref:hemerythrin domain-containing protein n=1 Tax=Phytoactinopolyspora endophytica TaxID=1642495 RepID=UPI00101B6907|nr:hemerythrin domain-containing protein [Phytoactinopolyspora endophytica]
MAQQSSTVVDVIVQDHREVEELFKQVEAATDATDRRNLTDQIIAELVRHSVAEEQYLYPAMRQHLANGDDLVDEEISEHAEAEEVMKELESLDVADASFQEKLNALISDVRHHIEEEENEALPRLAETCPQDELIRLGEQVERAKRVAPTRPHPSAPDTPPMNKILAPGAGLIDRIRDALSGRQTG